MGGRVLAFVLLAACGGTDGSGEVLFEDDFAGTYPDPNWVGDGVLLTDTGAPAPALNVKSVPPVVMAVTQLANPVQLPASGFRLSFDALNVAETGLSDLNLFDVNTNENTVYITFRAADIRFHTPGAATGVTPITPDTDFHAYEVHVSGSGATEWRRDGAVQVQGQLAEMPTLARIIVRSDTNGIVIDNVRIVAD